MLASSCKSFGSMMVSFALKLVMLNWLLVVGESAGRESGRKDLDKRASRGSVQRSQDIDSGPSAAAFGVFRASAFRVEAQQTTTHTHTLSRLKGQISRYKLRTKGKARFSSKDDRDAFVG